MAPISSLNSPTFFCLHIYSLWLLSVHNVGKRFPHTNATLTFHSCVFVLQRVSSSSDLRGKVQGRTRQWEKWKLKPSTVPLPIKSHLSNPSRHYGFHQLVHALSLPCSPTCWRPSYRVQKAILDPPHLPRFRALIRRPWFAAARPAQKEEGHPFRAQRGSVDYVSRGRRRRSRRSFGGERIRASDWIPSVHLIFITFRLDRIPF